MTHQKLEKRIEKRIMECSFVILGFWLMILMLLHNGTHPHHVLFVMLMLTIGLIVATVVGSYYLCYLLFEWIRKINHVKFRHIKKHHHKWRH